MTAAGETFECARCGGTFLKSRSDEEAIAEMRETWQPHDGDDDPAVVCDPCFRHILGRARREAPEVLRP